MSDLFVAFIKEPLLWFVWFLTILMFSAIEILVLLNTKMKKSMGNSIAKQRKHF